MTVEFKIDLFSARVLKWQLEIARRLADEPDSGFAAIAVAASYLEMIAKMERGFTGSGQSKKHFKLAVADIFQELPIRYPVAAEAIAEVLYEELRCGMYHDTITGPRIVISGNLPFPLQGQFLSAQVNGLDVAQVGTVDINPQLFIDRLLAHFAEYTQRLRDPANADLRARFEGRFTI